MTITLTKTKLAIAILAMALMIPATAFATDAWSDVDDGRFYHDAVAWAKANGMTTGCDGGTGFCPDRGVTRGENITFAKRYDDLVVQPALESIQDDVDDNASDIGRLGPMYWAVIAADGDIISRSFGVNSSVAETQRISEGSYEVDFTEVDDVADCHVMVSRSDSSSVNVSEGAIYAEKRSSDTSSIFVNTRDETFTNDDSPFTLQLWCSPAAVDFPIIVLEDVSTDSDITDQDAG